MPNKAVKIKDLKTASRRFAQVLQTEIEDMEKGDLAHNLIQLHAAMARFSRELFEASISQGTKHK